MEVVISIIVILFIIFLLYVFFETRNCNKKIKEYFANGNVIVYGAKGHGKDLLFQKHLILTKKKKYMSNLNYGYNGYLVPINELNINPNNYGNFISGNVFQLDKKNEWEGIDYYLSDAGVHLPCQMDYELHKKYPSFPLYYALSRHLYKSNIHCNCQALGRVWKAIREQADGFIKCIKVIKLPYILICFIRFYDKYESAYSNLLPLSSRTFNKYSKATADQYEATNGEIKNMFYIIKKKDIKYDTRHFEKIVFKESTIER